MGVDRTYLFNYLFYQEGGHNYGLTGRQHTPLRAMAGYATAIRFLSHKHYIGDIPNKVSPNGRGRVFANADRSEIVACVYSGSWGQDEFSGEMQPETPPGPMVRTLCSGVTFHVHNVQENDIVLFGVCVHQWSWFMPITGAFELDGSPVSYHCEESSGCQWGNYDRLSWLTLNSSVLQILDYPTIATSLQAFGAGYHSTGHLVATAGDDDRQRRILPPPVILQMVYDNRTTGVRPLEGSSLGYSVAAARAHSFALVINLNNMHTAAGGDVTLTCSVKPGPAMAQNTIITLTPGEVASASFTLDLASAVEAASVLGAAAMLQLWGVATVDVTVTGTWGSGGGGDWTEVLSMNFITV